MHTARYAHKKGQRSLPYNQRIPTMTDGTDDKPIRVDVDQPVHRLTRKPALEVSTTPLKRPCRSHLLRQIFQHLMRIPVQPVDHIGEIDNNRPLSNNLDHSDR